MDKVSNTTAPNTAESLKKGFIESHATIDMQYNAGERLKFKAISGIYSTVKTDIPTQNKTLTFNFIACTDGDNNHYPVVEIGEQIWMAENLKATKFNDNSDIPLIEDLVEWSSLETPGYCWYNNDSATYNETYGVLYNGYTLNSNKLCPIGWHVPSDSEWTVLTNFLGGSDVAGGKLKEAGFAHWFDPNTGATDETGFSALPGGFRLYDGAFLGIGDDGLWWSSSEFSNNSNWSRTLRSFNSFLDRGSNSIVDGFSVRCLQDLTTLTTLSVTEITTTSALSGGNIISDLGYPITARGVCWSTHENPTIADGIVTNNTEVDSFTCLITGLTINTKYYLRAYATNSLGTGYGNEIMFSTKGEIGFVSDIDGNTYSTIEIGTQTWMAENLKTTKYNDGTNIPQVSDSAAWSNLSTPGFCWYDNDSATYNATYGALYNWYTVNNGNLCPIGWHVSTDEDWYKLFDYLGGRGDAFGKLKENGISHWLLSDVDATNETGFNALPGGYRFINGTFNSVGYSSYWWISNGWYQKIYPDEALWTGLDNRDGFSVRCVKD
jgi:uncharacterized protein (TIGR02145 family)